MSKKEPEADGHTDTEGRLTAAFKRVLEGDATAWLVLESACKEEFLAKLDFINRGLAEDALQETLLMVSRNPSPFRSATRLEKYLYRVSVNNLFRLMREGRGANPWSPSELRQQDKEDSTPAAIEQVIAAEQADQLHQAIEGLDENYRFVIREHWFKNNSLEEIAGLLNTSSNTIRTWHRRAKEQLALALRREK